jgi:RNA polymerase subunit RPABC4/transcription elongation factor Spt4
MSMFEEPSVTPFIECPNCKRLLEYRVEICPACCEEIGDEYALVSAAVVVINTQAVGLANTIKSGNALAFMVVVAFLYSIYIDWDIPDLPSFSIWVPLSTAVPLLAIALWLVKYGRFGLGDEEYIQAKRDVRASLRLWLGILSGQIIALFFLFRYLRIKGS